MASSTVLNGQSFRSTFFRGLINGTIYGTKVRLPHALVMTALFKSPKTPWDFLLRIAKLTFMHARNLGFFVGIYKSILAVGHGLMPVSREYDGSPARHWHALVAGAVGGWLVWGHDNPVNRQIVMYLFARVMLAFVKLASRKGIRPFDAYTMKTTYPYFATAVWMAVMWLFEYHPETLEGGLLSSMKYIYHDSNNVRVPLLESAAGHSAFGRPFLVVLAIMLWYKRDSLPDLLDLGQKL